MRFLFYRYNNICENDVMEAFKALGHEIDTIELEIYDKNPGQKKILDTVVAAFDKKTYDGVFSINYYPILSKLCNIYKVLYISWTTDCPVNELLSETVSSPFNRIFCFDYSQYEEISRYNPGRVFYMPLAANIDRWDAVISSADAEMKEKYSSEVSFVGSLYEDKNSFEQLAKLPDYLRGYAEGIINAQQRIYGAYILDEVLDDKMAEDISKAMENFYHPADDRQNNVQWILSNMYLGFWTTAVERRETLRILGNNFNTDIYTGSNTTGLRVNNRGIAKTFTEMPLVFANSKININTTCRPIKTGIPQRIWDICGCGGFVLTNYQSELENFFIIGEDIAVYTSMDDMIEKIRYYLDNEKERARIARNGYEKVKGEHTFKHRVGDILYLAFA